MKRFKLVGVVAIIGVMVVAGLVFGGPSSNSVLGEIQFKVLSVAHASGSWVCSKCGFHIVTKSGNKPSPGKCFKNNNGAHDWEKGN